MWGAGASDNIPAIPRQCPRRASVGGRRRLALSSGRASGGSEVAEGSSPDTEWYAATVTDTLGGAVYVKWEVSVEIQL